MIYGKNPLSIEAQADQLLARGLVGNKVELMERLRAVNYYRLTGYLYPFRQPDNSYTPGTTLNLIWRRYCFDRKLRILLMDAIERIEVAVRTQAVHQFVMAHGAFGHLDRRNLPGFKKPWWLKRWAKNFWRWIRRKHVKRVEYKVWLTKLKTEKGRSQEAFVKHFDATYGSHHDQLPLWMACELMTCETLLQFLSNLEPALRKQVAAHFGFPDEQFMSWTKAIFSLRNACAHHSRIWNRVFGVKPSVPGKNKNPNWHLAPGFDLDRLGLQLTVCHFWLGKITPTTLWRQRVFDLFAQYPEIPLTSMGLPPGWQAHPLWV